MSSPQPLCYNCQKPLEVSPPYFCSDKCKATYWHESEIKTEEPRPKTIKEIQEKLLQRASELREKQKIANRQNLHKELKQQFNPTEQPVDFFAGLNDQPHGELR